MFNDNLELQGDQREDVENSFDANLQTEQEIAEFEQWLDSNDGELADDDGYSDAEADANTLASAGWGTDEDYGSFE